MPTPNPIIEAAAEPGPLVRPASRHRSGIAGGLLAVVIAGFTVLALRTGTGPDGTPARRLTWRSATAAAPRNGRRCTTGTRSPSSSCRPTASVPGQVGTLIDEQANPLDVTATIVDLAVRGYLKITEIPKEGWFGKPDWQLQQLKDTEGLMPYEAELLTGIFKDGPRCHAVRR